ncbi:MAG: ABC transporter ATP-binding protein [Alphaproteobacteria bacterium]|nr:ABC transporter ATP-binding protein [Alphaproteobacteria bacterium]MBQ9235138.1 ABC transporter ATP-binding protein [Alphaproteobacteria bacterium]
MSAIITIKNLCKTYQRGSETVKAVNNISLEVEQGNIVAVVGPSGSGKTTLVNILGCLDNPTSGELWLNDKKIFEDGLFLSEKELTLIRRQYFGYIFQKFFLLPTLSIKENIMLPEVFGIKADINEQKAAEIMDLLGINHRAEHLPSELSGGEMQRVAIARALITNPKILIADEPTGNLDTRRAEEIKNLLIDLNRKQGITIILVTHNPELAQIADKVLFMEDGKIKK